LETRTQRHFQWLLHSELPMIDNEDGTVEIKGEKSKLIIHPVLPIEHNYKLPPPRVSPRNGKEFQCFSLRPIWHHLWNVSPGRSPYPQWDARSRSPLYGRDVKFLVVLSVMQRDEPYDKVVNPVVTDKITGVEIVAGDEINKVYFNPCGSLFQIGDAVSDGEKVVVREKDGKIFSWALVQGRRLRYNGDEIVSKANTGNIMQ